MKKPAMWGLVIGVLTTISSAFQLYSLLIDPTELAGVNAAAIATAVLTILLGVFLIVVYIYSKSAEEVGSGPVEIIPNSPEDRAKLESYRNWIIGFFIAFTVIGSVQTWILNDYRELNLMNAKVTFDLFANVVFVYFMVQLFRGKHSVLHGLLYTTVFYAVVYALFAGMLEQWAALLAALVYAVYVSYAVLMPMTRTNFRIAQYLLLPLVFIAPMIASVITEKEVSDVSREHDKAWEEFSANTDLINGEYSLYLDKEYPDAVLIEDVESAISKRSVNANDVEVHRNALVELIGKQTPTIAQQKTLERLRLNGELLKVHAAQTDSLSELMTYSKTVNFAALTVAQKQKLSDMKAAIDAHTETLNGIVFDLNRSNLWN